MENKNHRMLEKALDILEYISNYPNGATLLEICTDLELPKSSAYGLVMTFANMGYLNKNLDNRFTIGIKAFEVGSTFMENQDFHSYSRDVLAELVRATNETAHLALLDGRNVVYLSKFDCTHVIRMVSSIGKRIPAHATALGKALLSGKTEQEIRTLYAEHPLQKVTPNTIDDIEMLLEQVEQIRQTGFAFESEESTVGVHCIAVPVSDYTGKIQMAISLSVPLIRGEFDFEQVKKPLLQAKKKMGLIRKS